VASERHNAIAGQPVKLCVYWHTLQVPLDPAQIRQVQILNFETGALVETIDEADVVREGPGRYCVTMTGAPAETYIDRWFVTPAAGGVETTHDFAVTVVAVAGDDNCLPISSAQLVSDYLYGLNLTDDNGDPFPVSLYDRAVRFGVAKVARMLDIDILPVEFYGKDDPLMADGGRLPTVKDDQGRYGAERHDFWGYDQFSALKLNRRPLRGNGPTEVRVIYPGYDKEIFTFPKSWLRVTIPESSQIAIVPAVGSLPSQVLGGGGGLPLFVHTRGARHMPDLLHIDYKAGFECGQVPDDITHAVALVAAQNVLNPAGDLIVGAGIASTSLSIGGLSQSVNTTSSATNAGYGSRIIQYQKDLKDLIPSIRAHYHGLGMHVA